MNTSLTLSNTLGVRDFFSLRAAELSGEAAKASCEAARKKTSCTNPFYSAHNNATFKSNQPNLLIRDDSSWY